MAISAATVKRAKLCLSQETYDYTGGKLHYTDLVPGVRFRLRNQFARALARFWAAPYCRVEFKGALISAHCFVLLVGLEIAVTHTFKAKHSGKLFFLACACESGGLLVSCFSFAQSIQSEIDTGQKIEGLKRMRTYFSRRFQVGVCFL